MQYQKHLYTISKTLIYNIKNTYIQYQKHFLLFFTIKTKKENALNLCQINLSLKNLKTKKEQAINLCQKYFHSCNTYTSS